MSAISPQGTIDHPIDIDHVRNGSEPPKYVQMWENGYLWVYERPEYKNKARADFKLLRKTDYKGNVTKYNYDSHNRMTSCITTNRKGKVIARKFFKYNPGTNCLAKVTDGKGKVTRRPPSIQEMALQRRAAQEKRAHTVSKHATKAHKAGSKHK